MTQPSDMDTTQSLPSFKSIANRAGVPAAANHALDDLLCRMLDIAASAVGLLLLSPLFLLVALLIKQSSRGPVFYRGLRAGKGGKPFHILKFRTMVEDTAAYTGPKVTGRDDSRVTPLGRFLRETKLNELPQLWNVLIGEMALVGPRPEDFEIAATWPDEYKQEILSVRPGITSPASIVYRWEEELLQGGNVMDQYLTTILPDKLRIDQIYIRRRSLLVVLDILLLTMAVLFPVFNQAKLERGNLFYWGPVSRAIAKYINWFFIDLFITFLAVSLAGFLWRLEYPLDLGLPRFIVLATLASLLFSFTNASIGLQNISWRHASYTEIVPLTISVLFSFIALVFTDAVLTPGALPWEWADFHLPFNVHIRLATFAWFGFVVARYNHRIITGTAYLLARRGGTPAIMRGRVLIVGAGQNANLAIWLLNNHFFRQFTIIGLVDDEPTKQGMRFYGQPVLGTSDTIPELANRHSIDLIVYTIKQIEDAERQRILALCNATGLHVVQLPQLLDGLEQAFSPARKEAQP